MKQGISKRWILVLGLCFIASSASARKINDLENELIVLKTRMDALEEREEKYRKEVLEVKKETADQVMQVRKDQADLRVEIDAMKQKLTQMEELIKQLSYQMSELEQKLQAQEQAQLAGQTTAEPTSETKESGQGASLYNQALDNFNKKKYDVARAQFEAFLKANPKDPYSDNAQFWIGETYFQEKNYKYAITEYLKVQENYPNGNKVPAALYKIGLCFEMLGKKTEAQAMYKQLIANYPNSEEAQKAKAQLEKLSKQEKTAK